MLVIVEGPDGSGKSTLCKQLADAGMTVVRRARHNNISYFKINCMIKSSIYYVMDRCILTTWAYRIAQGEDLDRDDFAMPEILHILWNAKIIYCCALDAYQQSINRGEDNITNFDLANRIRNTYSFVLDTIDLYRLSKYSVYNYDWHTDNVDNIIKFIKE